MRLTTSSIGIGALLILAALPASAQDAAPPQVIAAPAEPDAIPLYTKPAIGRAGTENWSLYFGKERVVRNVTLPTLTPFLPAPGKATGAAVIVAPGGAFMLLAIEPEGWRVARALADRGIAAFVLKYRIMPTPQSEAEAAGFIQRKVAEGLPDPTKQPNLQFPPSTQDALAALALVRQNATQWNVDPQRVGMIGFSAGAMTSLNTVLAAEPKRGPDFFGYIYGPQAAVKVPTDAPPMFDAIAFDDEIFQTLGFPIAEAWKAEKRPVELHAYQRGKHGFGLSREGTTTTQVLDQFVAWMAMNGFLSSKK
jgi:acetyl esterase/lipase